jgi:hypothetical protein
MHSARLYFDWFGHNWMRGSLPGDLAGALRRYVLIRACR